MLTDPTRCEQKVPCPSGSGFEQCRRRWAEAVVVADPAATSRRPRRFCSEHAREARRNKGTASLLVRRPEPLYTYRQAGAGGRDRLGRSEAEAAERSSGSCDRWQAVPSRWRGFESIASLRSRTWRMAPAPRRLGAGRQRELGLNRPAIRQCVHVAGRFRLQRARMEGNTTTVGTIPAEDARPILGMDVSRQRDEAQGGRSATHRPAPGLVRIRSQ
jgi:hypothetical protein